MEQSLFARQSIYDANLNVVGYELIHQPTQNSKALTPSTKALLHSIVDIGLENIANNFPLHIKIPITLLNSLDLIELDYPLVLDLVMNQAIDDELLEKLQDLKVLGYQLALSDYTQAKNYQLEKLTPLLNIIKIDTANIDAKVIAQQTHALANYGVDILLENIETKEAFDALKETGADYFHGHFLEVPSKIKSQSVSPNNLILLNLISKLRKKHQQLLMKLQT